MIDKNRAPNYSTDLVILHKNCKSCNKELINELRVPNYGGIGYQKLCRTCRNLKSLKLGRKRAQILKDNPLW